MRRGIAYGLGGFVFGLLFYHLVSVFILAPSIVPVFSPDNGNEIISMIDTAESSVDIEMYVFTSRDVIDALESAKNRGVKIRIIIERKTISGSNDQIYQELAAKGFNIRYASSSYKLTHSKFMIIDGKKLLVGSHNFSNSAINYNREASVIISDQAAIADFKEVFETDWLLAA